jgi:hypothetical protein
VQLPKNSVAEITGYIHRMNCGENSCLGGEFASSKWATIEKCSPDTALRDIADLVGRGILAKDAGGGRSTSYSLVEDSAE